MDEATEAQKVYIETLEQQTGEHVDDIDDLTEGEASETIDELRHKRDESDWVQRDPQDIAAETDPDLSDDDAA